MKFFSLSKYDVQVLIFSFNISVVHGSHNNRVFDNWSSQGDVGSIRERCSIYKLLGRKFGSSCKAHFLSLSHPSFQFLIHLFLYFSFFPSFFFAFLIFCFSFILSLHSLLSPFHLFPYISSPSSHSDSHQ